MKLCCKNQNFATRVIENYKYNKFHMTLKGLLFGYRSSWWFIFIFFRFVRSGELQVNHTSYYANASRATSVRAIVSIDVISGTMAAIVDWWWTVTDSSSISTTVSTTEGPRRPCRPGAINLTTQNEFNITVLQLLPTDAYFFANQNLAKKPLQLVCTLLALAAASGCFPMKPFKR